jgi:hypothetical protein
MLSTTALATVLAFAGCGNFNTKVVDPLIVDLAKINATAIADLNGAQAVAMAANDTDGFNCAGAAIKVSTQINVVIAAANVTGAGVFTTAELASVFQPGSQQYNAAKQTLTSGCAAKGQDVLGAAGVLAVGGVVGAIASGQLLPALAAVP